MGCKVSVIVPVYNTEKFICQCVDSLLAQTLADIEIILVNDCSPDNCLSIMEDYRAKFPDKVKVIDSPVNLKQGGARNLGIKIAEGEYIGFVDSDDAVAPEMYERLYAACSSDKTDAAFVQYMSIKEDERYESHLNFRKSKIVWSADMLASYNGKELSVADKSELICNYPTSVCCGIYKRELIVKNELFFPEHLRYEDNFWVTLTKMYLDKVVYLPEVMYFYRANSQSTVNQMNQSYQFDRIRIEKMLLEEIAKRGLTQDYMDAMEYIFTFRAVFNTILTLSLRFDKTPKKEILELRSELKRKFPRWKRNRFYKANFGGGS